MPAEVYRLTSEDDRLFAYFYVNCYPGTLTSGWFERRYQTVCEWAIAIHSDDGWEYSASWSLNGDEFAELRDGYCTYKGVRRRAKKLEGHLLESAMREHFYDM